MAVIDGCLHSGIRQSDFHQPTDLSDLWRMDTYVRDEFESLDVFTHMYSKQNYSIF